MPATKPLRQVLRPIRNRSNAAILANLLGYRPRYLATDADGAGDQVAEAWPSYSIRVRPPGSFKDWTEAAQGGIDLRRWWSDRLAGVEAPELFTWDELKTWRWGDSPTQDGDDGLPDGIEIPEDDWRWEVANLPMDAWNAWHRRAGELEAEEVRPGDGPAERAKAIERAQHRAYIVTHTPRGADADAR